MPQSHLSLKDPTAKTQSIAMLRVVRWSRYHKHMNLVVTKKVVATNIQGCLGDCYVSTCLDQVKWYTDRIHLTYLYPS